jgi:hypothetical protein
MARGTQLLKLVEMVRNEVGRATNVAVGVDDVPELKAKIRRQQELFYDDYDWPFLRQVFPVKPLQAGELYYDFPVGLNVTRIEKVVLWYNNLPRDLDRGITFAEYAIYNSLAGTPVRQSPARRWDVRWTGTKEQMEIWPVPSDNSQTVQMAGIRNLRPLINDSDAADLDDQLIALAVAGELLQKQENANASTVLKLAGARLASMKGRAHDGGAARFRLGMGDGEDHSNRLQIVVRAR